MPRDLAVDPKKEKRDRQRQKKELVHEKRNEALRQALREGGAVAEPTTAASQPSARAPATNSKRSALAAAIDGAVSSSSSSIALCDTYGRGSPTDRLQFGYSPAHAEEAVAFHRSTSAAHWIATRRRLGNICFIKKQKLHQLNCEPLTTMLALRKYWAQRQAYQTGVRKGVDEDGNGWLQGDRADAFLEELAARQAFAGEPEGEGESEQQPIAVPKVSRKKLESF